MAGAGICDGGTMRMVLGSWEKVEGTCPFPLLQSANLALVSSIVKTYQVSPGKVEM